MLDEFDLNEIKGVFHCFTGGEKELEKTSTSSMNFTIGMPRPFSPLVMSRSDMSSGLVFVVFWSFVVAAVSVMVCCAVCVAWDVV